MQTRSRSDSRRASPTKKPLLSRLWWVSVAPLGAPVVPLVNWMLMGSSNCRRRARSRRDSTLAGLASRGTSSKARRPGSGLAPDPHDGAKVGQGRGPQPPRRRPVQLGSDRAQHADVVGALERGGGDEGLAPDAGERVLHLVPPVGGVDVDEHDPRPRRRELGHDPLRVVRRPDAEPVALLEPEGHEAGGERVGPGPQLPVRPADALVAHDEGLPIGRLLGDPVERLPDRLAEERLYGGAVGVAALEPGHVAPPSGRVLTSPGERAYHARFEAGRHSSRPHKPGRDECWRPRPILETHRESRGFEDLRGEAGVRRRRRRGGCDSTAQMISTS